MEFEILFKSEFIDQEKFLFFQSKTLKKSLKNFQKRFKSNFDGH